jgi:hypothetical protein
MQAADPVEALNLPAMQLAHEPTAPVVPAAQPGSTMPNSVSVSITSVSSPLLTFLESISVQEVEGSAGLTALVPCSFHTAGHLLFAPVHLILYEDNVFWEVNVYIIHWLVLCLDFQ